jgi:hypothetical protein
LESSSNLKPQKSKIGFLKKIGFQLVKVFFGLLVTGKNNSVSHPSGFIPLLFLVCSSFVVCSAFLASADNKNCIFHSPVSEVGQDEDVSS